MTTRDIRPSTATTVCDVCGRTLLRGERAEAYLHGGARRWVCELCKSRALNEGWVREGTLPPYNAAGVGSERRRSWFSRLRARRNDPVQDLLGEDMHAPVDLSGADGAPGVPGEPPAPVPASDARRSRASRDRASSTGRERPSVRDRAGSARERAAGARERATSARERATGARDGAAREPRHVRAVPTNPEHKTAQAVQLFNGSEHPRTLAGVARSLGLPTVAVLPSQTHASLVTVVASWELCWYRYELDLSEEVPSARVAAQGYELEELAAEERVPNATATDDGMLELG